MKVLNLRCANGHTFEGWFGGEDDFLEQNRTQRIECPLCSDRVIVKALSAPRLNLGATRGELDSSGDASNVVRHPSVDTTSTPVASNAMPASMQALWMQAVKHVLANTDDVGDRFAEEARRIHYGETAQRGIRGQASADERAALEDEGIDVTSLPMPASLKGPLQ